MNSMKPRGFTIIELLLAIAAGLIVIGGSLYAFRAVANTAVSTSQAARVTSKLELALNRIKADLEGQPTAVVLPESNNTHAVAAYFTGPGVQAEPDPNFATATSVTVTTTSGSPVAPGDPAILINSAGQVLVIPAVENVTAVDADSVRIDHGACPNGMVYTPSTMLYPAQLVYIAAGSDVPGGKPDAIYRKVGGGPWEAIAYGLSNFNISYLYHDAVGNIVHDPEYGAYTVGAPAPVTAPAASPERTYRLYALDLFAEASSGSVAREYNAQVRLNQNTGTALRTVTVCGGGSTAPSTPPTTGGVTGTLNVTITGLPAGQPAAVDVSGPNGYTNRLLASTLLRDLETGNYTIAAGDVWSDAYTAWSGSPATQAATVTSWTPANATVTYSKVLVDLTVSITGLPAGAAADVTVSGPGGFFQTLTASQIFNNLEPGSGYRVDAREVWSDALTQWVPNPATQTFDLRSYAPYTASVSYAYVPCRLDVSVVGLPAGVAPDVTLTGPAGFSDAITQTAKSYPSLRPGNYTATGNIVSDGTYDYEVASVAPAPAACKSGEAAAITVTYAKMVGSIITDVNGPPGDTPSPTVNLLLGSRVAYSYSTSGRHTETEAKVGSYTVDVKQAGPKSFTDSATGISYDVIYDGTSTLSAFTLNRGDTVQLTVNYTLVPGYVRYGNLGTTQTVAPGVYRPEDLGYSDYTEVDSIQNEPAGSSCALYDIGSPWPQPGDTCYNLFISYDEVTRGDYTPNVFGVSSGKTATIGLNLDTARYTTNEQYDYYLYCADNDGDGRPDARIYTGSSGTSYVYDASYNLTGTWPYSYPSSETCP